MDRRQLECFLAVVDGGSFTAAAKECRLTQPALSAQISKLEAALDHPLFSREKRKVFLTEAGKHLVPRARRILQEFTTAENYFAREMTEESGQLAIGCIPTIAPYVLPPASRSFLHRFPKARISATECLTEQVLVQLKDGTIDVGILSPPFPEEGLQTAMLHHDPFVAAVPRNSELASRKSLKIDELKGQPFVVMQEMHCLGRQISQVCFQHQLTDKIICQSSQLSTIKEFVASGLGISILPQLAATEDRNGRIVFLPIEDDTAHRKIIAAWAKTKDSGLLLEGFLKILKDLSL